MMKFRGRVGRALLGSTLIFLGVAATAAAQTGDLVWATRAGSNSIDEGKAVAVDDADNVYATGYFKSTATFGPAEANETMLTSTGQDVYVAKYDPLGGLVWVQQVMSPAAFGNAIALDGSGNIYVFGHFNISMTFEPGLPGEFTLNSLAGQDLFLAKYDNDGGFVWATVAGGNNSEFGLGLAVDDAGNSFVTGRHGSNPITFGPGEANETMLAGVGGSNGEDIYVAKYDSDGLLLWAKSAGGVNGNSGAAIGVDAAGNSYVTGRYSGVATFGAGETNETVLNSGVPVNAEVFIAKYDPDGNLVWARAGGGQAQADSGDGIAVDAAGNSYTTGSYRTVPPFGGQLNFTQTQRAGLDDIFLAKHDTDGTLQWVKMAVGPAIDFSLAAGLDSTGNVYITGYGAGITFGAEEPNETALGGVGAQDVFVAKFDNDGLLRWATLAGGSSDDRGHGIAVGTSASAHVTGRFGQTATFGAGEPNATALVSRGNFDIYVAKFQSPLALLCGDANADGSISATDARIALQTGVGSGTCQACTCDVDLSGTINATDALLTLQNGVGQPVALMCAGC